MNLRLGELLIKKNMLTKAQLEEALQAQVIFGGKLGTVLIEMGLISEGALAENLAQQLSIPCAQPGQLQEIPADVIKIISPELAEKHKVVPVAVNGKKLTLAMADPHNLKSIDEISFRTGYIVRPVLALEVRLVFALEEYYGIKRTMRYIAPPRQVRDELNQVHIFDTPEGPVVATETDEDLGMPGSEWVTRSLRKPQNLLSRLEELADQDLVEEVDEEVDRGSRRGSRRGGRRGREHHPGDHRPGLGQCYRPRRCCRCHHHLPRCTLRPGGSIHGGCRPSHRLALGQGRQASPGIRPVSAAALRTVHFEDRGGEQELFLGPVPQNSANLALTTVLGKPAPKTALLIPMSMLGRVVGLIYVDDTAKDLPQAVVDVQQLVSKALMAFELLILQNKILRL